MATPWVVDEAAEWDRLLAAKDREISMLRRTLAQAVIALAAAHGITEAEAHLRLTGHPHPTEEDL